MPSKTKHIYDEHIRPLPREQRVQLLDLLRDEPDNEDADAHHHSILELHGLGQEIWQGTDPSEYVKGLRDQWEERR